MISGDHCIEQRLGAKENVMIQRKAASLGRLKQEIQPIIEKSLENRVIWSKI